MNREVLWHDSLNPNAWPMDSEGSTDFSAGEDRKVRKNPYQQMVGMAD